ncbi:hypothetical protein B0H19DRAFT_1276837 [Mycena capillaripes]|nr:hypothetical protein B0H19DRAFT_1276837 [Mycena capillaripes]
MDDGLSMGVGVMPPASRSRNFESVPKEWPHWMSLYFALHSILFVSFLSLPPTIPIFPSIILPALSLDVGFPPSFLILIHFTNATQRKWIQEPPPRVHLKDERARYVLIDDDIVPCAAAHPPNTPRLRSNGGGCLRSSPLAAAQHVQSIPCWSLEIHRRHI